MSEADGEKDVEITAEEKEQERIIIKEIEKLEFFVEDASESYDNEDYDELKSELAKCDSIHNKIRESITTLQEFKLELGKTARSIRQWKKTLRDSFGHLVHRKSELQRLLDDKIKERDEATTAESLHSKHKKEEEFRKMMFEKEKQLLEERFKAEIKLTERKLEMERTEKQRRTKLPELKITPFKGTPGDWIRFENMFISQIHNSPISDEEKFGYLLEFVGSKVRDRLSNLKPGSVGYKTAWERLQSEYGHNKLVSAAHMDELINLAPVRGTSYEKVREFYEKLTTHFDALISLGEGDTLRALVIPTINKLPQVKPDIVRTDDDWEDWDMTKLLESIQKWLRRNRVDESTKEDNPKKREKHFFVNTLESNSASSKGKSPKCLYWVGEATGGNRVRYILQ